MRPVFVYVYMRDMNKIEPPARLRTNILMRIGQEERHRAKIFLSVFAPIVLLSIVGSVLSLRYVLEGFYQSSFYSYFSLLLSDPDIVFMYWREFALSLTDTIPFTGITLSLIAIAIFLVSLKSLVNNLRGGFNLKFINS